MTVAFRTVRLRSDPPGVLRYRMLRLADGSLLRLAVARRTGLRGGRTVAVARLMPLRSAKRRNPFVWLTTKKDVTRLVGVLAQRGDRPQVRTLRESHRGRRGLYEVWGDPRLLTETELRGLAEHAQRNPVPGWWVDPRGQEHGIGPGGTHRGWLLDHMPQLTVKEAIRQGWVRIRSFVNGAAEIAVEVASQAQVLPAARLARDIALAEGVVDYDRNRLRDMTVEWLREPRGRVSLDPETLRVTEQSTENPRESPTLRRTYVVSGSFGSVLFTRPLTDQDRARRLAVRLQSLGWSGVRIEPTLRAMPRPRNPRRAGRSEKGKP